MMIPIQSLKLTFKNLSILAGRIIIYRCFFDDISSITDKNNRQLTDNEIISLLACIWSLIDTNMSSFYQNIAKKNLSASIADWHQQGYLKDYMLTKDHRISCLQDDVCYNYHQLALSLVDLIYDNLAGQFYYIHTVCTDDGHKGILLSYGQRKKSAHGSRRTMQKTIDVFWEAL